MNICITQTDDQPEYIGGIERVSSILGKEWQKKHHVSFISYCTSPLKYKYDNVCGIPRHFLPDDRAMDSEDNYRFLLQYLSDNRIDILLNQFSDEMEMGRLCIRVHEASGIKLVSTLHFAVTHKTDAIRTSFFIRQKEGKAVSRYLLDAMFWMRFRLFSKRKIEQEFGRYFRGIYQYSDLMVLLSDKFSTDFRRLLGKQITDYSKLIAINNPVPTELIGLHPHSKEKMIVWCGRLEYSYKRIDRMLEVWKCFQASHPDWSLYVLGGGNLPMFRRLADRSGLKNINFEGFCNPYEYYERAAILCMTSSSEGWPMVLVEGMAHGCVPIVYNSFASLTDIVMDGMNGFIAKAFDEKEYVRKLSVLADNSSLRERMSLRGMEYIEQFDSKRIAGRWISEFDKLLEK